MRRSLKTSALVTALLLAPFLGHAATRIKTVEFTFGSRAASAAPADIASGSAWTPASITAYIPESGSGITVRSAWVEVYAHCTGVETSNPFVRVNFDAGAAANTERDVVNAQYSNQTGETYIVRVLADVTANIVAAASQQYTMSLTLTGPASNTHSAKLYITYEYSDQAATQIQTVRFPLYSVLGSSIATRQTQAAAGTYGFSYNAQIPEAAPTIRSYWFEIQGYQQNGGNTTDCTVRAEVSGQVAGNLIVLDEVNRTDRWFVYIATGLAGFVRNTQQTLNITTTKATNVLGGELVVTYEAAKTEATKCKTVKYFFNQGTARGTGSAFGSVTAAFSEYGFTPKQAYARLMGTYDSTSVGSPSVTSSVGGQALTARAYDMIQSIGQSISSYQVFHSLNEKISSLTDGAAVDLDYTGITNNGSMGVELIFTYHYTGDDDYTAYYEVMGGQKANATSTGFTDSFTTYFPEATNVTTLRGAWIDCAMISSLGTANKTTVTLVGSQTAQTVQHDNSAESNLIWYLRDALDQVTTTGAAYSTGQTNGTTNQNSAYNFTGKVTYTVEHKSTSTFTNAASTIANNSKKSSVLELLVTNNRPAGYNKIELSEVRPRITDGAGSPTNLTLAQTQNLFNNIFIYVDSLTLGTTGVYEPDFDTVAVATVTVAQIDATRFASGVLTINNSNSTLANPDTTAALQITTGTPKTFFVVADMKSNANAQTPNTFAFSVDADSTTAGSGNVVNRDGPTNTMLGINNTSVVTSQQVTAIAPAATPGGYTVPNVSTPIYSIPVLGEDGKVYLTASDGFLRRFNATSGGAAEWSYNSGNSIRSSPWTSGGITPPPPYDDVYFGNDGGKVIRINGNAGGGPTPTWTRTITGNPQVRSSPGFDGSFVYIGAGDNKLYKLKFADGTDAAAYTPPNLGGLVTSSPAVVSGFMYVGSDATSGNTFYAVNASNGTPSASGAFGQIVASPVIDTVTGYIYFGSKNGTFYARNGSTLGAIAGWADFSTGSSIQSSAWLVRISGGTKYIYFGADNGKIYKLNAATGAQVWQYPAGSLSLGKIVSNPVANNAQGVADYLVFGTDDGGIYVLKNLDQAAPTLATGFPVFTGAPIQGSASIDKSVAALNKVYIGGVDGKLYRYDVSVP